jgi:hypothetical protein
LIEAGIGNYLRVNSSLGSKKPSVKTGEFFKGIVLKMWE